ncbi:MAG TPA: hypothetical protein VHN80_21595 [Kineosporiaceae bacterium]|nr:hypothetical protein [Kineosporiaceae bacterium]
MTGYDPVLLVADDVYSTDAQALQFIHTAEGGLNTEPARPV